MTLIIPVATYGAGSWIMNKDITKRPPAFKIKVLKRMFGGFKVIEIWRKQSN
jgi:hypothetical protein